MVAPRRVPPGWGGSGIRWDRRTRRRLSEEERLGEAGLALVATTVITALVHTLIPDHWLPFVLVSRAQQWSARRTLALTATSALLHVIVSICLGLGIVWLGHGAEQMMVGIAESLESLTGWMLVAFGLAYMGWFLLRGGHVHSFGMHPHHHPLAAHRQAGASVQRSNLTGYALALIVGFNPCILLLPTVYGAARISRFALAAVAASFALTTVVTMVSATLLGLRGTTRLTSAFLTRYGEALSGGLIALTGVVVMLAGIAG